MCHEVVIKIFTIFQSFWEFNLDQDIIAHELNGLTIDVVHVSTWP